MTLYRENNFIRIFALVVFALALLIGGVSVAEEKKAVLVISPGDFRDEELFETKKELAAGGVEVTVACTTTEKVKGMMQGVTKADMLLDKVKVEDFDAIVFIGGVGAKTYFNHPKALSLAKEFAAAGKVTAAICIAPVILGNAGVLQGKKATVSKSKSGEIKKKGATYTGDSVVRDGKVITANGPKASRDFAKVILQAL